jgi:hypothetical protein
MTSKKSTRTQFRITDIYESEETLQAVALRAERATLMALPVAEIDDNDDDDHYDDLGGQRNTDSQIENKCHSAGRGMKILGTNRRGCGTN